MTRRGAVGPANVLISSTEVTTSDPGTRPAALGQPSISPAIVARRVLVMTGAPDLVSVTFVLMSVSSSIFTSEPENAASRTVWTSETAVIPPEVWVARSVPTSS